VEKGQIVAVVGGSCSSNLHAPVGGKVRNISKVQTPCGMMGEAVVIAKEGDQELQLMKPLDDRTPDAIRERAKEAGIVGMGGAGFPTHIKLNPPKKIDTVFLNACECEPYLTADERMMVEKPAEVINGFILAKQAVGAQAGIIGIEEDKKDAVESMRRAVSRNSDVAIRVLPKVYPQGYEKMLITAVTGREVPSGGLPHDVGVSVHNVGTCLALHYAVVEGRPLIDRVLTLGGPGVINSVNVRASIGTKVNEIIGYYQIEKRDSYKVLMGGPMMGIPLDSLEVSITKTTSGILLVIPRKYEERPCSGCGKCVDVCPMNLVPQRLNRFFDGEAADKMKNEGLFDCMECGCCSYICPCRIPLAYKFKGAKLLVN
jgi:electron transport complex protein RnfC